MRHWLEPLASSPVNFFTFLLWKMGGVEMEACWFFSYKNISRRLLIEVFWSSSFESS